MDASLFSTPLPLDLIHCPNQHQTISISTSDRRITLAEISSHSFVHQISTNSGTFISFQPCLPISGMHLLSQLLLSGLLVNECRSASCQQNLQLEASSHDQTANLEFYLVLSMLSVFPTSSLFLKAFLSTNP